MFRCSVNVEKVAIKIIQIIWIKVAKSFLVIQWVKELYYKQMCGLESFGPVAVVLWIFHYRNSPISGPHTFAFSCNCFKNSTIGVKTVK